VKHQFIGEEQGKSLAEWLNQKGQRAEREKVIALIAAIRDLDIAIGQDVYSAIGRAAEEMGGPGKKSFRLGSRLPVSRPYLKMLRRVDRLLADCWMRPRLTEHGGKCRFDWVYKKAGTHGVHLLIQLMELESWILFAPGRVAEGGCS
jgi:hypothetical protein